MAGLEEKIDGVAERILAAAKKGAEEGKLPLEAVSFARDTHAYLTKGTSPRKLLTREYVLYLLLAGMDEGTFGSSLDAFLIGRVSNLRKSSRTLDSIRTVMTSFGESDFYSRMAGFEKEHVQEESSRGERGKCFVCPEKPNAILLLRDPSTGQKFSMGFDCYKTLLTTLVPDKSSQEYAALEEYVRSAEQKIRESESLAKSISARERQRLHEFDEFIVSLKDDKMLSAAVKEARSIGKEHGERYRELDAKFWREIGRLMEKAGQYHDITIATSIAEPKRGWFGMLDTLVSEGGSELMKGIVDEQKAALYTPSLGSRLILYNEVLSRLTGGWRNIAGDIVEGIYHARETDALTPAQLRVYSGVGLFQRIEAFMHADVPDKGIFSEEHRIPYRDLLAIFVIYEGGVKGQRMTKNREALAEFEGKGHDLADVVLELESLSKARILSTELPKAIRDFSQRKWQVYSFNHLVYSDHDFVRMLERRWTQGIEGIGAEALRGNALALEPHYRFREIIERLESLADGYFPITGEIEQRITSVVSGLENPYLLLEQRVKRGIGRMVNLKSMTKKGLEKIEAAESALGDVIGDLKKEKHLLHYALPGVDIMDPSVVSSFLAYQERTGKAVAFMLDDVAVAHTFSPDSLKGRDFYDARIMHAAVIGTKDVVGMDACVERDPSFLDKAVYLSKVGNATLRFSGAKLKSTHDLGVLTKEHEVASGLVDCVIHDYDAVKRGEAELLRTVRSEHREVYASLTDKDRDERQFTSLRVITSGKADAEGKAYLSNLGFVETQKGNMMKRFQYAHNLTDLVVGIAEYNRGKKQTEQIQVWLFENEQRTR